MGHEPLFQNHIINEFLESALPDLVLAFAFFTSMAYAVLGKRFDHQRSAITMSVTIGFALSIGLIWWERSTGFSIKNLGPIAIGFAIIVLAFIMCQAIRKVGGSWAGAAIALGACIIIASIFGLNWPIDPQIIQTITTVALIIGILAFLTHYKGHPVHMPSYRPPLANIRHDMSDLYRNRCLSKQITNSMRNLRKDAASLYERPKNAGNVMIQLKRMLPAEGYLTERMAQLRAKAHRIREGHIARLEETKHIYHKLPTSAKKKGSGELIVRYKQLVGIDLRLERLDKAVAENEKRIRELTGKAQIYTANYEHKKLHHTLKAAEKLQHHNDKLFKIIDRTEKKLTAIAMKVAQETREVDNA